MRLVLLSAMLCAILVSHAASQNIVWEERTKFQSLFQKKNYKKRLSTIAKQQDYQLNQISSKNTDHIRYQILYKGVPIWGYQVIYHKQVGKNPSFTGLQVSGIEDDIQSIQGKITSKNAQKKILESYQNTKLQLTQKIIFLDKNNKAHLAYHVTFFSSNAKSPMQLINIIINANSGDILKKWDAASSERIGQGLGGNTFPLPYRPGMFQYGDALPGLPSLGKIDVKLHGEHCYVENHHIKVFNLANIELGEAAFPITVLAEKKLNLPVFSYSCQEGGLFLNYSDGITGPVNYAFSPVNDAMYFADKTIEMFQRSYQISKPIGDDLPLKLYTHLGMMDNAFAVPTITLGKQVLAHQQIVIGNGSEFLTAPAQTVLAHELSHLFTAINSNLIYDGQPGAINESFSDMASIALLDYLSKDYPWYWDARDWTIGREAVIGGGKPIRYLDDPTKDGISIAHQDEYSEKLDVHQTSGVFNKAFYNLAKKRNYGIQRSFQLMVDANRKYWTPIAYFDFAACGVIQAAHDRRWDVQAVIESFAEVGVNCPVPPL